MTLSNSLCKLVGMQGLRAQIEQRQSMKGRSFYVTVEIHPRLLDPHANKRLLTLEHFKRQGKNPLEKKMNRKQQQQ